MYVRFRGSIPVNIDADVIAKIVEGLNIDVESGKPLRYVAYSNKTGIVVLRRGGGYLTYSAPDVIDGVEFSDLNGVSVWKDGEFCKLRTAFENGWFTHDDLLIISNNLETLSRGD